MTANVGQTVGAVIALVGLALFALASGARVLGKRPRADPPDSDEDPPESPESA